MTLAIDVYIEACREFEEAFTRFVLDRKIGEERIKQRGLVCTICGFSRGCTIWFANADGLFCFDCCRRQGIDDRGDTWRKKDLLRLAWLKRSFGKDIGVEVAGDDFQEDWNRIYPQYCTQCSAQVRFLDIVYLDSRIGDSRRGFCSVKCATEVEEEDRVYRASLSITSALSCARTAKLPATLTATQWQQTIDHFNDLCAYCGKYWYVVEHVVPVRRGGGTSWDNCVPSCRRCNALKRSQTAEEFGHAWPSNKKNIEKVLVWLQSRSSDASRT